MSTSLLVILAIVTAMLYLLLYAYEIHAWFTKNKDREEDDN